jgi:hypothetical protein
MATHLQQLTGRGVKEKDLEHCPTTYHFELSPEEFEEFIRDPASTLERLGIPYPKPLNIYLERWDEVYSETEGWQSARPAQDYCAHGGDDGGLVIHKH